MRRQSCDSGAGHLSHTAWLTGPPRALLASLTVVDEVALLLAVAAMAVASMPAMPAMAPVASISRHLKGTGCQASRCQRGGQLGGEGGWSGDDLLHGRQVGLPCCGGESGEVAVHPYGGGPVTTRGETLEAHEGEDRGAVGGKDGGRGSGVACWEPGDEPEGEVVVAGVIVEEEGEGDTTDAGGGGVGQVGHKGGCREEHEPHRA